MKVFDWEELKKKRGPKVVEFLKEFHDLSLTEEKFVELWGKLKEFSVHSHLSARYGPAKARQEYRNLKAKFGFFQ